VEKAEGCLTKIVVLVIVVVGIWWLSSNYIFHSNSSLKRPQENCSTNLIPSPAELNPIRLGTNVFTGFLNDTNPFPQTPTISISRTLFAVQERQISKFVSGFEESADFSEVDLDLGTSGCFYNADIRLVRSDDKIAHVQLDVIWIPSQLGEVYAEGIALHICRQLTLVRSKKPAGFEVSFGAGNVVNLGLNLGGWYLREDQIDEFPYHASMEFENLLLSGEIPEPIPIPSPMMNPNDNQLNEESDTQKESTGWGKSCLICLGTTVVIIVAILAFFYWLGSEDEENGADDVLFNKSSPIADTRDLTDLTQILGIDVSIASTLHSEGIDSLQHMGQVSTDHLTQLLKSNNYTDIDPRSWPIQAQILVLFSNITEKLLVQIRTAVGGVGEPYLRRYLSQIIDEMAFEEVTKDANNELRSEIALELAEKLHLLYERWPLQISSISKLEKRIVNDLLKSMTSSPADHTIELEIKLRGFKYIMHTLEKQELTFISGIGPASQQVLQAEGIITFRSLSEIEPKQIDRMFAKHRVRAKNTVNWVAQASYLDAIVQVATLYQRLMDFDENYIKTEINNELRCAKLLVCGIVIGLATIHGKFSNQLQQTINLNWEVKEILSLLADRVDLIKWIAYRTQFEYQSGIVKEFQDVMHWQNLIGLNQAVGRFIVFRDKFRFESKKRTFDILFDDIVHIEQSDISLIIKTEDAKIRFSKSTFENTSTSASLSNELTWYWQNSMQKIPNNSNTANTGH